jgi:hypothetical protein
LREERALRIDAPVAVRDRERRSVGGEDRSAALRDVRVARIVRVGIEGRRLDDGDPELAQREDGEEQDEERAQSRDGAVGQPASPARSRKSV